MHTTTPLAEATSDRSYWTGERNIAGIITCHKHTCRNGASQAAARALKTMYFRPRREYTPGETALEECQARRFMPIVQVVDSQWVEQASDRTLFGAKMAQQSMAKCAKSLQTLTAQFRMQVMEVVPAAAFVRAFRASVC